MKNESALIRCAGDRDCSRITRCLSYCDRQTHAVQLSRFDRCKIVTRVHLCGESFLLVRRALCQKVQLRLRLLSLWFRPLSVR